MSTVTERPILFNDEMQRANLADLKTQTRRPIDKRALALLAQGFSPEYVARRENGVCRYGYPGDHLWGREAWSADIEIPGTGDLWWHETPKTFRSWRATTYLFYRADGVIVHGGRHENTDVSLATDWPYRVSTWRPTRDDMAGFRWQPSIHMPRWASRTLFEITELRAQRVQEISEGDIVAEGATVDRVSARTGVPWAQIPTLFHAWRLAWNATYGEGAWERNDWVWAITYRRIH